MPQTPPVASDDAAESVLELAARDPFRPRRWLDRYSDQLSLVLRSEQVGAVLRDGPPPLVASDGGDVAGALVWRPIPDLADFFEVPVHEVFALLVEPEADRRAVAASLLGALRGELGGGRGLVMFRIEADDVAGLGGATDAGFRVLETSIAFVNDYERRHLNPPYDPAGMGIHSFDDGPLPDEMHAALSRAPTGIVNDHYHADPRLDDARCDALYDRMRDRVLQGIGADVLIYRRFDGIYHGYGTFKRATGVAAHGITLLDGALGYKLPGPSVGPIGATGNYICNVPLLDSRLLQWDTQLTNYAVTNMLLGPRSLKLAHATHMLHCWTDEL
jgi:hypothetical protein